MGKQKVKIVLLVLWLALGLVLVSALSAAESYVGSAKCRICHLQQYRSWQQTRMAQAYELLKPGVATDAKRAHKLDADKDYTHDSSCLPCHTTGYGKPGGFESIEKTPGLAGIQCEVCHGPGGGYLKPNLMSLQNKEYKRAALVAVGMTLPNEKVCQECHNPKSPFYQAFDYPTRKVQGTHEHLPLKYPHE